MDVRVRAGTTADVGTIFDIRIGVRENHLSRAQLADLGITPDTIAAVIAKEPCLWIAEIDGQAVGFSMIDGEKATVFAAFVHPEFEGRGAGRALMAKAEAELFRLHDAIRLETDGASRAAGFYRKLGWIVVEDLADGDVRFEKRRR